MDGVEIVVSAIVMTVTQESELWRFPLLGVLRFVAASAGGVWLLVSI